MSKKIVHPMKAKDDEVVCQVPDCGLVIGHENVGIAHINTNTNKLAEEPEEPEEGPSAIPPWAANINDL